MKVYLVVIDGSDEGQPPGDFADDSPQSVSVSILGVFASRAAADAYKAELDAQRNWGAVYVMEWGVDGDA